MVSRLHSIRNFGQKIWLDNISRQLLQSEELIKLITEDGISGITSNPSIFYKAITTDKSYQKDLDAIKHSTDDLENRLEQLSILDIKNACDMFYPIYKESQKDDGYVSFEVSPLLANNSDKTIEQGLKLWQTINKPNLMIKVPATTAGIKALTELTRQGINVNITLIFSLVQLVNVWQAYTKGLELRLQDGHKIDHIKAVASFFLSRIDSSIDDKLPQSLQGKTAINLAKAAYLIYQETFSSSLFNKLKKHGANPQNLLWASTGTKNPNYSDVMYIEELIGIDTINTIPSETLIAFKHHGNAKNTITKDIEIATKNLEEIKKIINLEELGNKLQQDGLDLFNDSYQKLLELMK
jgi:transaldolase